MLSYLIAVAGCCAVLSSPSADVIRFDFESGDLQGFQVALGNFATPLCSREFCRNEPTRRIGNQGKWFLSTVELPGGAFDDGQTGVILGKEITAEEHDVINGDLVPLFQELRGQAAAAISRAARYEHPFELTRHMREILD